MKYLWYVLSTIVGMVAAFVLIVAIQSINMVLFPPPADLNFQNRDAMNSYIATLPITAFFIVLAAYCVGTLAGTWVATRINPTRHIAPACVTCTLLLIANVMNLMSIPHPVWFMIATAAIYPTMTLLGILTARKS